MRLSTSAPRPIVPSVSALRLVVTGQVQGVGFRPFVYRLAKACGLTGAVRNSVEGVVIEVEGPEAALASFRVRIVEEAPAPARIDDIQAGPSFPTGARSFRIEESKASATGRARVPRDLATCPACRADVLASGRRRGYPFASCTACGPRYSMIEAMPYDRSATAMRTFSMCRPCDREYRAPEDRRFHAQPNACADCGPVVGLQDAAGRSVAGPEAAIRASAALLKQGQIVAIKGLGGFQLLVRADDSAAVTRLRQRKQRPAKPLAVMVRDETVASALAHLDAAEHRTLNSAQNPIVLVRPRGTSLLAPEVAPRAGTVGLFLPTTPLHLLLLSELPFPIVATSGNRGDEPIVIDERTAPRELGGIADAFLVHNRPIVRRVDDSVVRVIGGRPVTFRLARGYAPLPLPTLESSKDAPPLLAVGGHQKSAVAAWTGNQAILGPHIGDLDGATNRAAFEAVVLDLESLYGFTPAAIACDWHPEFYTTRWAEAQGKPVVRVQHHHAHALACMAEHGLLDREVLAFTWDGTGYGSDGTVWGGEVLRARVNSFDRVAALRPFPLPGGDAAIRHPNRVAFGLLQAALGDEVVLCQDRWARWLGLAPTDMVLLGTMVRRGVNCPWTTSMGRLFDAVAALILGIRNVSYEGEAAVYLEAVADPMVTTCYRMPQGDWRPLLTDLLADLERGRDVAEVAGKFHNTLASWAAVVAAAQPQVDVVLSGGCFQNRLLTERIIEAIRQGGRRVYHHELVPPGDGGLAVGQLAAALTSQGGG